MSDRIVTILEDLTNEPDCHDIKKVACEVRDIAVEEFLKGKRLIVSQCLGE